MHHGCAPKINKAAMEIVGVESCDVNFIDSKAVITYDNEKVSASNILESLKENTTFKYNLNKDINTNSETSCASQSKKHVVINQKSREKIVYPKTIWILTFFMCKFRSYTLIK